ncbi:MAG: ABC transporter substrate-binding protein [Saprospiraceae bacterium]
MNRLQSLFLLALLGLLTFTACKTDPQKENVAYKRTANEVLVRLRAEPDRLNPVLTTNAYARQISDQIFQYLITVDPQTFEFIPLLAKALPTTTDITEGPNKGGVAYTFEIHDAAVWDNGSPVTGNDFAFTVKSVLNPLVQAQRIRPYFEFIKDVQIDPANPKKFTVLTNEKYILGMEAIGSTVPVLPEYIFDAKGLLKNISIGELSDTSKVAKLAESNQNLKQFADEFNATEASREKSYLVGSGPYRFEEWQTGQKVRLVKKENWWGDKLAKDFPGLTALPQRLDYQILPEPATVLAAIRSEELDATPDIDAKDFDELRNDAAMKAVYNFSTETQLAYACLYVNNQNPKLSDKRVRRAIAHAINVDEIIKTVYNGYGERIAVPLLPSFSYYDKSLKPVEFYIQKAKDLLAEAGWKDSNNNGTVDKNLNGELTELNLTCTVAATNETGKSTLLLAQGTLKQAGINLEIVPKEFTVMMDDVRKDNFELASGARTLSPTVWDPTQDWLADNYNNFQNAQAAKIIEQIRVTLDANKRNELYKQLQNIIYEEQPAIFVFAPAQRIAIHKRFDVKTTSLTPGFFPNSFVINLDVEN